MGGWPRSDRIWSQISIFFKHSYILNHVFFKTHICRDVYVVILVGDADIQPYLTWVTQKVADFWGLGLDDFINREKQKISEQTLAKVNTVKVPSLWSVPTSALWATGGRKSIWVVAFVITNRISVWWCVCKCGHEAKWWCPVLPPAPQLAPSWPSQMLISHVEILHRGSKCSFHTFCIFLFPSIGDKCMLLHKLPYRDSHFKAICFFQIFL